MTGESLGEGRWSVTAVLDRSVSAIAVTVLRPGLADVTAEYPWTVAPATGPVRMATLSNAPIGGYLTLASACLFAVFIGAGMLLVLRRRRTSADVGDSDRAAGEFAVSGVE